MENKFEFFEISLCYVFFRCWITCNCFLWKWVASCIILWHMSHWHTAVYLCSGMTLKGTNHHSLTGPSWEVIKICYLSINNTPTINYEHFFLDSQHLYSIFQYCVPDFIKIVLNGLTHVIFTIIPMAWKY